MAARLLGPASLALCFAMSTAVAAVLQPAGSLARCTSQGIADCPRQAGPVPPFPSRSRFFAWRHTYAMSLSRQKSPHNVMLHASPYFEWKSALTAYEKADQKGIRLFATVAPHPQNQAAEAELRILVAGTLRLRGGNNEHTGVHGGSVEVMDDDNEKTAFAKITWKRNSGPLPSRKVEVRPQLAQGNLAPVVNGARSIPPGLDCRISQSKPMQSIPLYHAPDGAF